MAPHQYRTTTAKLDVSANSKHKGHAAVTAAVAIERGCLTFHLVSSKARFQQQQNNSSRVANRISKRWYQNNSWRQPVAVAGDN